jgi:hypothetical protein
MRFVGFKKPISESDPAGIKYYGYVGANVFPQQLGKHVRKSVYRIYGNPISPRHWRKRMEGSENEAGTINEN